MSRRSNLLTEEVSKRAESALSELGNRDAISIKLRAIISAHKHGIGYVAKAFDITKETLITWIKHVSKGEDGIKLLRVQKGRGRKHPVTESNQEVVRGWMKADHQITIDKLRDKIKRELEVEISRSSTHRLMKKLDFSYITARPRHYKQDPERFSSAKKKSIRTNWIKA